MNQEVFLQPRFVGERFEAATLPLKVASDLSAYEDLVYELARHLYLEAHPDKKYVPKGFAASFQLHVTKIEEGSSRPILAMIAAGALALTGGPFESYFTRSRDTVSELIASPVGALPESFPKELLPYFKKIGLSLRPGERMELPRAGAAPATLTAERRKQLILEFSDAYEESIEVVAPVAAVNWVQNFFQIQLLDGRLIQFELTPQFRQIIGDFGSENRHGFYFKGTVTFSGAGAQKEINLIETLEPIWDVAMQNRILEFTQYEEGWLDGIGRPFEREALAALAVRLAGAFPAHSLLPSIYPTAHGAVRLEWELPNSPSLEIQMSDWKGYFHSLGADENSDIELEFNLATDGGWDEVFDFLRKTLRPA